MIRQKSLNVLLLTMVGLALLALFARIWVLRYHQVWEPLDVTVRIVDARTGGPLDDAVVVVAWDAGVVKWEMFDRYVWCTLRQGSFGDRQMPTLLAARRTGGSAEVTLSARVEVTRHWIGSVQCWQTIRVPELLLIDPDRGGRQMVLIDDMHLVPGAERHTWQLDLGTLTVGTP